MTFRLSITRTRSAIRNTASGQALPLKAAGAAVEEVHQQVLQSEDPYPAGD